MLQLALALALLAAPAPAAPPAPAFEGQLAGNGSHACFLRPTRDVVCWGLDLQNATGVNPPSGEPQRVAGLGEVQEIAVGLAHACAIKKGGQVACWGYNGLGQLGTSPDRSFHAQPADVPGLTDLVHLASGPNRTCGVHANGGVTCWGSWDPFQAIDAQLTDVLGVTDVKELVMGDTHVCALSGNGHVACWGDNGLGQVGNGQKSRGHFDVTTASAVVGLEDAVHLSAAGVDTCAVKQGGQVVCWGGRSGSLVATGHPGQLVPATAPVAVPGAIDADRVFLTHEAGCLTRKKDGQLACWWSPVEPWAQADYAKLHPVSAKPVEIKQPPELAKGTRQLIGAEESYALVKGGKLLHWGAHAARLAAVPVKGLTDAVAVSTGANQSCAVRANGQVACWGAIGQGIESSGSDGVLASRFSNAPVAVPKLKDAVSVSVGAAHACALGKTGQVTCWGNDAAGQLGNGKRGAGLSLALRTKARIMSPIPPPELLPREAPSAVKLPAKAIQVAAGTDATCAVLESGQLFCWGANAHGQLGTGNKSPALSPVQVPNLSDVAQVSVGDANACALKKDGNVLCWGRDRLGLLGDGKDGEDLLAPTPVGNVVGATGVAVGEGAVCALLKGGTATCWGRKSRFLGDEQTDPRGGGTAVVRGLTDAASLAMGVDHRCVRHTSGTVSCWGRNLAGVIGDGTRVDRATPVEVVGLGPTKAVSAGVAQSCAIKVGGQVVCWGAHLSGALGDGRDPSAPTALALAISAPAAAPAAPAVNATPAATHP